MAIRLNGFPFDSQITGQTPDGLPVYDRASSADEFSRLLADFFRDGVFGNAALAVTAAGGMSVTVAPGGVLVRGRTKNLQAAQNITIEAASNQPRYDRVVIRRDLSLSVRDLVLDVLKGTPSASPVVPSLTRDGTIWEICLANVYVPANATAIDQPNITDTRLDDDLCGLVAAVMSSVDTTSLYLQIQSDLERFQEEEQASFMLWFENLQASLDGNIAGNLQNQIDRKVEAKTVRVTLLAGGWIPAGDIVTQSVVVEGLTRTAGVIVAPSPDNHNDYASYGVYALSQDVSTLTFACDSAPDIDLDANVLIMFVGAGAGEIPGGGGGSGESCECMSLTEEELEVLLQ